MSGKWGGWGDRPRPIFPVFLNKNFCPVVAFTERLLTTTSFGLLDMNCFVYVACPRTAGKRDVDRREQDKCAPAHCVSPLASVPTLLADFFSVGTTFTPPSHHLQTTFTPPLHHLYTGEFTVSPVFRRQQQSAVPPS